MFHLNNEQIRSVGCGPLGGVISAVIGSLIFNWQVKRWSHRIPTKFDGKEKNQLLKEYRVTNRIAKVLALAGLSTILLYYRKQHEWTGCDWRGIGIAVGLMAFLPVAYVVATNIMAGSEKVREALTAYIIDQRTPPKVVFALTATCSIIGVMCAISLLFWPP